MSALPAGVHRLDAETYHGDELRDVPTLSSTLARLMLTRSPLHVWTAHPRLNPAWEPTERKTFDIGRAAHRVVLGAGSDFAVYPPEVLASNGAASTKAAKDWEAEVRASGLTPIKAEDEQRILAMADAVRAHLAAMRITFDPAHSELTALGEVDGVWCRAMVDNAPLDKRLPLYDFKTTMDASPEACVRAVAGYGYDVQARFYLDVWEAATGERRRMRFVFVEKDPPHGVSVVELHDDESAESDWMLDAGAKCREARRMWAECLASGQWPGYPTRVAVIGAPGWHRQAWANREPGLPVATKPGTETLARATAWQAP